MDPFDHLLPYLSTRVAASEVTPEGGRYARLDNDLYFHTYIMQNKFGFRPSFEIRFLLFFNPDGSHATPPIEILGKLLTVHLGYHFSEPGGILGQPTIREAARRVGEEIGIGSLSLTRWWVKESHPVPPGAPRNWGAAGSLLEPHRRKGPEGYDWPDLGRKILNGVDAMLELLEMTRPVEGSRPLEPR